MAHAASASAKCGAKHLEFSVINSLYLQSSIEQFSRKKIAHLSNNLDEFFSVINIEERYILTSWTKSKLNREIDIMKFIATRTLTMHINMFFRNTID